MPATETSREQQPRDGQHGPERPAHRRGLCPQHPGEDDRAARTEQDEREVQEPDHAEHEVDALRSRLPGQHLLDHSGTACTRLPDGEDERPVHRVRVGRDDAPGDRVRAAWKPRTHADGDLVRLGLRRRPVVDPMEPAVVDADRAESTLDRLVEGEHDLLRGTREHGAVGRRRRDERCVGERRGSHDQRHCDGRDQHGARPPCHPNRPGHAHLLRVRRATRTAPPPGSAQGDREDRASRTRVRARKPAERADGCWAGRARYRGRPAHARRARARASARRPTAAGRGGTRRTRPAAAVAAPRRTSVGGTHPRGKRRRGTAARSAPARRRSRAPAPRTSGRTVEMMRCRGRSRDGGALQ